MDRLKKLNFSPPEHCLQIRTIDMHTLGEPLRIITSGLPELAGDHILEKRRFFKENYDHIRTSLIWEPRGHADMYGAVITEPSDEKHDFAVFFLHNEGYSTMCGHAIIALTTFMYQSALFDYNTHPYLNIEVPAGIIKAWPVIKNDRIVSASFLNVPSFVLYENIEIVLDGKMVNLDIAYGGAFYAILDASQIGLEIMRKNARLFVEFNRAIVREINANYGIVHPFEKDLGFLYGSIFTGSPKDKSNHSRNICVFANGEVDRSPTGSGLSARVAVMMQKNQLTVNERIRIESIIDTLMEVEIREKIKYGHYDAVIPEVNGSAFFTGKHEFWINPDDPLRMGFLLA